MSNIEFLLLAFYTGLLIFSLNGLQWMAVRRKQQELAVDNERLRRLLIRSKLRR